MTSKNPTVTAVSSIQITALSNNVKAGNAINLAATITPSDATNKNISWSSSNNDYATVDANGKVTTKLAGAGKTVTITATSLDGSNVIGSYAFY